MSRFDGVRFDSNVQKLHETAKKRYEECASAIEACGTSSDFGRALKRLEESFMWFGKGLKELQMHADARPAKKSSAV